MIWILLASMALAESWCAVPLTAHEWGVQAFDVSGADVRGTAIPTWFHTDASGGTMAGVPVRTLPHDSGIRDLPVLQFYGPRVFGDTIPVAIDVGFTQGQASAWWPQVSKRQSPAEANSAESHRARARLLKERGQREPFSREYRALPTDPTAQLLWEGLDATRDAPRPESSGVPWIESLRDIEGALWLSNGTESERFVFYEADTSESPSLTLERGNSWTAARPHYVLRNTSDWPVHDVFFSADGFVFFAPSIPSGATAGLLLDQHRDRDPLSSLRARLIDPSATAPTDVIDWSKGCEMMRDPAIPQIEAEGHLLYAAEVDVLLDVWGDRFFSESPTLVYREDVRALQALMPLGIYTDMYHYVQLRRLGLVVVEGLTLP